MIEIKFDNGMIKTADNDSNALVSLVPMNAAKDTPIIAKLLLVKL